MSFRLNLLSDSECKTLLNTLPILKDNKKLLKLLVEIFSYFNKI